MLDQIIITISDKMAGESIFYDMHNPLRNINIYDAPMK